MKKKTYIQPTTILHKIMVKQTLLQASYTEGLGTTGVGGGSALSRRGNDIWEDDEDY